VNRPTAPEDLRSLEPVREHEGDHSLGRWTRRLIFFLRAMAAVSMIKGLYHWAQVCGIGFGEVVPFETRSIAWQTATVFFAVIDLVAAVGLWLAAAWGAVIWLTAVASMLAVEIFFPQVFGGGWLTGVLEGSLLAVYLWLALKSAQEHPRIGFIGLGNMGLPMAQNLLKAGHQVEGVDVSAAAVDKLKAAGGVGVETAKTAAARADVVITMLPSGKEVREVYLGSSGIIEDANAGTLLIDCSTIDVETSRAVASEAEKKGLLMLDAPVSGGVGGATAASLTFMVGGSAQAFARAESILQKMGKTIVHAGGAGNGQAAKICNNMILGVSMIAVSEAFVLAEKLGLDHQKLFDISSKSSGQCWSMTSYCPVPGPVPTSPANREYQAGFTAAMMLKDLKLSQDAAKNSGTKTELGADAARIYSQYVASGEASRDFSGIIRFIRG
jgi:3-hydroxyisobutyrate dehydrogenase